MLRRRHVNVKTVKELDAFPKVPELYVDKTAVGGTCELMDISTIFVLKINIYIYTFIITYILYLVRDSR